MHQDIQKILLTEEQIQSKVRELAKQLSADYADKDPVFIGVLKGCVVFFGDMIKYIDIPCQIDFMWISSYQGTESRQMLVRQDVTADIKGRHVLILEDILDSGRTLAAIKEILLQRGPASVKICTLLDKPEGRVVPLEADYTCFTVPDEFVVGFGLDYNEGYRNLPYVGVLKPEVYL